MDKHHIRSKQVSPLPIGSGGNNPTKQQLNATNAQLTMMSSQAIADTKYDPPVPKPVTTPTTIENFTELDTQSLGVTIGIIGSLLIIYGMIAK